MMHFQMTYEEATAARSGRYIDPQDFKADPHMLCGTGEANAPGTRVVSRVDCPACIACWKAEGPKTAAQMAKLIEAGTPQYDGDGNKIVDAAICGTCHRSWNDAMITGWTPAPSGRCPFEYWHKSAPEGQDSVIVKTATAPTVAMSKPLFDRVRFFIDGLAMMEVFKNELPSRRVLHKEAVNLSKWLGKLAGGAQ